MRKLLKVSSLLNKGYCSCTIEQKDDHYKVTTFTGITNSIRKTFKVENIVVDIDFKDSSFYTHANMRFRTFKLSYPSMYINLYTKV